MITKSPSQCDGQPVGTPTQAFRVYAKTKKGRRRATREHGVTFERVGPRKFSRIRTDASFGSAKAHARLLARAVKWHDQGWKTKTIAKRLGMPESDVVQMLWDAREQPSDAPRLVKPDR